MPAFQVVIGQTGRMTGDPRALRSRRRLQDALRCLLEREELTEIGVSELCRAAGVHRTTFYGHYTSVGDVASDLYASWLDDVAEFPVAPSDTIDALAAHYLEATAAVLRSVTAERRTLRALLASEFSLDFRRRLQSLFDARIAAAIAHFRQRGLDAEFDDALGAAFVGGGFVGAVLLWVTSEEEDEDAFTRGILVHTPAWWPRLD